MKTISKIFFLLALLFSLTANAEPWHVVYSVDPAIRQLNDLSIPSLSVIYVVGGGPVVGGSGIILKSEDGGDSWVTNYTVTTVAGSNRAIYGIDCQSPLICYAAGADGRIYETTNGGVTPWSVTTLFLSARPGMTPIFHDIRVVDPSAGVVVAVGDSGSIFRRTVSASGTESWSRLSAPAIPSSITAASYLSSIHCSGSTCYISGYDRALLKSVDAGATWVALSSSDLIGNCGGVFTLDGSKVWAGCTNIGKSIDGWGSHSLSSTSYDWPQSSIAFTDDSHGWVLNGLFGAPIRKTIDGGVTWPDTPSEDLSVLNSDGSTYTTGTIFRAIEFRGDSLGFVVGDGVIARRHLPVARIVGTDLTMTVYPNLVPDVIWSHACSNASGTLGLIAGVRNNGAGGVPASQFPFSVRLETLGEDGNPIAGASRDYSISAFTGTDRASALIDFTQGGTVSPGDLYRLFNPNGVSTPNIRMTVDVGNVVRESSEDDNVISRTIVCGPPAGGSGGASRESGGGSPQPAPPARSNEGGRQKRFKSNWKR